MSNKLAILGGQPVRGGPFPTWPIFDHREERALVEVLRSGKWGKLDGDETARFENAFAEYQQAKHGIAVTNGTISLRIALMALGIEAGDEVIVPAYTFLATATAVVEANGAPVFVDIDRHSFNMDPEQVERSITQKTRAIIVVHLGGLPCDMDRITAIAARHDIAVIEDAAHAHGSECKGRRVGAIGRIGSLSFQSTKNLTCGEGGIILTNDELLAERCRSIHNCGRVKGGAWYEHHGMNGNYRLGEFQAAILNCQLDRLDEQTRRRDENGRYLDQKLRQIPGITPQLRTADATRCAYHLYAMRYDQSVFGAPRQRFLEAISAEGIRIAPGYLLPLYRQPLFLKREFGPYSGAMSSRIDYARLHLPNCEAICTGEGMWLTQNMLLGSQEDMDDIVAAFEKVYRNRAALR